MGDVAVNVFIALQLIGASGFVLIMLLIELLERENARHPAWWSFCVSWVVLSVSYSILCLAGMQFSPHPNQTLCTIQAGLTYAAPPLVAHTTLALIIQLRSVMHFTLGKSDKPLSRKMRIVLAIVPWALWLFIILGVLVTGFLNPKIAKMNEAGMYCHLDPVVTSKVLAGWLLVVALAILWVEISLMVIMFRLGFPLSINCYACRTTIRLGIFLLQAIASFGAALAIIISDSTSPTLDVLLAIQPTIAMIVFGTKAKIPRLWSQKKEEPLNHTETENARDCINAVFVIGRLPSSRSSQELHPTNGSPKNRPSLLPADI